MSRRNKKDKDNNKDKQGGIHNFMSGRNGMDELSRLLLFAIPVILIFATVFKLFPLTIISIIVMAITYFRIFSKNVSKRFSENQAFLQFWSNTKCAVYRFKQIQADKKTHKVFKCPNCSQKIRVPRGKGIIMIKCPNCRIEFQKNTGNSSKT